MAKDHSTELTNSLLAVMPRPGDRSVVMTPRDQSLRFDVSKCRIGGHHFDGRRQAGRVLVAKLMRILDGETPASAVIKTELIARET